MTFDTWSTSPAAPAWVQAIGSVAAIAVAVALAERQSRFARLMEEQRRRGAEQEKESERLLHMVRLAFNLLDLKVEAGTISDAWRTFPAARGENLIAQDDHNPVAQEWRKDATRALRYCEWRGPVTEQALALTGHQIGHPHAGRIHQLAGHLTQARLIYMRSHDLIADPFTTVQSWKEWRNHAEQHASSMRQLIVDLFDKLAPNINADRLEPE